MRIRRSAGTAALVFLSLSTGAHAQAASDTLSLSGRTSIAFGIGLSGERSSNVAAADVRTHTTGQLASIALNHWVRPSLSVELSTAILSADQSAAPGRVHDNAIIPVLFGVTMSPQAFALSSSVRPFISLAAGPYVHMVQDVNGARVTTLTETTTGARAGVGANWFLTRHFLLNVEGDYHAVGKFDYPDALTSKPSGFGVSVGLGVTWGGRQ